MIMSNHVIDHVLSEYQFKLSDSRYLGEAHLILAGARCSSVVRALAHGAMGCRIDPLSGGPIELFLVLASAPQLV